MEPKQAWGAFSLIIILADAAAIALLISLGVDLLPVASLGVIILLIYFYVLYKRYHVEVVPESDIKLFDDPADLRILARIYGLDHSGDMATLKERLLGFARANKQNAFTWVAPKAVLSFGSVLEIPSESIATVRKARTDIVQSMVSPPTASEAQTRSLLGGKPRSSSRRSSITSCPICDSRAPSRGTICQECGADLEFYSVLGKSKIGRLVLSEKAGAMKRKLRYEVPSLRGTR